MTPEREAELFAKLDLMLELYRRLESDVREARADIRDLRAEVRDGRADGKETGERVARIEGRIEEQSKMLQIALADRVPRKPAA